MKHAEGILGALGVMCLLYSSFAPLFAMGIASAVQSPLIAVLVVVGGCLVTVAMIPLSFYLWSLSERIAQRQADRTANSSHTRP